MKSGEIFFLVTNLLRLNLDEAVHILDILYDALKGGRGK